MSGCPFCEWRENDIRGRLIVETAEFVAAPSRGQMVPGYVIVVPKRHVDCFAKLSAEELAAFAILRRRLEEAMLAAYYFLPVVFEHGICGQTIKHAHVHFVPISSSHRQQMLARIREDFGTPKRIGSLYDLPKRLAAKDRYLLFEERLFIVPPSVEVPPGYLRDVLGEVLGDPEAADWTKADPKIDAQRCREAQAMVRAHLR